MGRTDDRYPAMPGGPYLFLNGRRVVESQAEDAGNSALDYGGDIRPETTKGGLPLISGYQHGIAQNGFHVTFDPPMSGVPLVVLSGGIAGTNWKRHGIRYAYRGDSCVYGARSRQSRC